MGGLWGLLLVLDVAGNAVCMLSSLHALVRGRANVVALVLVVLLVVLHNALALCLLLQAQRLWGVGNLGGLALWVVSARSELM